MPVTLYSKPSITERELGYATDAAANGWGENCNHYVETFERLFAKHLGVRYAIATSSCTGALHMGLAALNIGPGDEVILPDLTWVASAAPITYVGATPVFIDVDRKTWCLDPALVEAAITPRTRAILAVHLYGNVCDMDVLGEIAARRGLALIEDAAEGIGSTWRGAPVGGIGDFGAFSFHGTKTIATGEGGMFVTNDQRLAERVKTLGNHGRSSQATRQFWPEEVGFKYKMSNLQAAIGCAQVERVEELVARKREIFDFYREALDGLPISMNWPDSRSGSGYWMPTVVVDRGVAFDRDLTLRILKENHIDARPFFWPLTSTGLFERRFLNPASYGLGQRGLNLPSYHDITAEQMSRVAEALRACIEGRPSLALPESIAG